MSERVAPMTVEEARRILAVLLGAADIPEETISNIDALRALATLLERKLETDALDQ
jgi:hypothetical protein